MSVRKVQENWKGMDMNGIFQLLVYVEGVNLLGININSINNDTETLLHTDTDIGLEVNAEKTKYYVHVSSLECKKKLKYENS
jgi:hypothetical protein